MAWRLVQQPGGKFARWSDIVDNFTDYDMTETEAKKLCMEDHGMSEPAAHAKFCRATENPHRYRECLEKIRRVHGESELGEVERLLGTPC